MILPAFTIEVFDADAPGRASHIVKKYRDLKLTLADAHGLADHASEEAGRLPADGPAFRVETRSRQN